MAKAKAKAKAKSSGSGVLGAIESIDKAAINLATEGQLTPSETKSLANPLAKAQEATPVVGPTLETATSIPAAITGVWTSAVNDAKYAGLVVAAVLLGALMIFHGLSGGGGGKTRVMPVPV